MQPFSLLREDLFEKKSLLAESVQGMDGSSSTGMLSTGCECRSMVQIESEIWRALERFKV